MQVLHDVEHMVRFNMTLDPASLELKESLHQRFRLWTSGARKHPSFDTVTGKVLLDVYWNEPAFERLGHADGLALKLLNDRTHHALCLCVSGKRVEVRFVVIHVNLFGMFEVVDQNVGERCKGDFHEHL